MGNLAPATRGLPNRGPGITLVRMAPGKPGGEDEIEKLREALRVSPDNPFLRGLLGEALLKCGRLEEAEREFAAGIALAPTNLQLKYGMAQVFYRGRKDAAAIELIEDILRQGGIPPELRILYCRLLVLSGDVTKAADQYRQAVAADPRVEDPALGVRLKAMTSPPEQEGEQQVSDQEQEVVESASPPWLEIERPKVAFNDVGGMEKVKEEIRLKIIHPITHPELYKAYGKSIGGGILLYGPPGCGKTYIARATAGEAKTGFLCMGISEVLDKFLGQSERNLHAFFDQARKHTPCILFVDEVDALGASRNESTQTLTRRTVNQFLAEMDGAKASNDGVLVLAATNAPWHLDSAFRRPGRFDRILFVPPPDQLARVAILRVLLAGKPTDSIDVEKLGSLTEHFTGADLKGLVDSAIEAKVKESMSSGRVELLTTAELLKAARGIKPSALEWFATAKNYATYANQSGLWDDVLAYMKLI